MRSNTAFGDVLCVFAGNLEFCETEIFEARCGIAEVILMQSARYGRMQFSRCIDRCATARFQRNVNLKKKQQPVFDVWLMALMNVK